MTLRITLLVLVTGLFTMIWTLDQPAPAPRLTEATPVEKLIPSKPESQKQHPVSWEANLCCERTLPKIREPMQVAKPVSQTAKNPSPCCLGKFGKQWAMVQAGQWSNRWNQWQEVAKTQKALKIKIPIVKPFENLEQIREANIVVPAELVPGEYRIVSNSGVVHQAELSLEDLRIHKRDAIKMQTREIYESAQGSQHWYFIRVQTQTEAIAPVVAERGVHLQTPAVAVRGISKHTPAVAERDVSQKIRQQASRILVEAGQQMFEHLAGLMKSQTDSNLKPAQAEKPPQTRLSSKKLNGQRF